MAYSDILTIFYPLKISWKRTVKLKKPTFGMLLEVRMLLQTIALTDIMITKEKDKRKLAGLKKTKKDTLIEMAELFLQKRPRWLSHRDLFRIQNKINKILDEQKNTGENNEKTINQNWASEVIDFLRFSAGMSKKEILGMYMDELVSTIHNIRKEKQSWACTLGVAFNNPQAAYDQLQELLHHAPSKMVLKEELKDKEKAFLADFKENKNAK